MTLVQAHGGQAPDSGGDLPEGLGQGPGVPGEDARGVQPQGRELCDSRCDGRRAVCRDG